jgi:hypothetical protein
MTDRKPNYYWTFEKCKEDALKYTTKKEFAEKSPSSYVKSNRNGWMNDISSHMILYGNKYKRCIYCYEFIEDNRVYIGLTYNINERESNRKRDKNDKVTKHINETGYVPVRKQLTDYIDVEEASKLEGEYLEKYKNDNWIILNTAKTGGIGGSTLYWTKEKCINSAKDCKTRNEFRIKYRGAYSSSVKNGWIIDIYHIIKQERINVKYTKDMCIEKSKYCQTRKDFKEKYKGEFDASYKYGWLDEISSHMIRKMKWTKDECKRASFNCINKNDFKKKHKGAYNSSIKNKWINDFFSKK